MPGLGRSVTRSRQGRRRGSTRRRGGQAPLTLRPRSPSGPAIPRRPWGRACGACPRLAASPGRAEGGGAVRCGAVRCGAVRCLRPSWQLLPCLPAGRCRFRTKLGASVVCGALRAKCRHLWFRACQSRHIVYLCFLIWGFFWRGESEW